MPTRKELRHFYQGPAWESTRDRILARAEGKCEACGKPDRDKVLTRIEPGVRMYWAPLMALRRPGLWRDQHGKPVPRLFERRSLIELELRVITAVISVCHVNGVAGDDRDENLAAWCQWHHVMADLALHSETRATRKDRDRPLLAEAVELEQLRAAQRWALSEHTLGNRQAVLGMSDALMEECLILIEGRT